MKRNLKQKFNFDKPMRVGVLDKNLVDLLRMTKLTVSDLRKIYNFEIKFKGLSEETRFDSQFLKWVMRNVILFKNFRNEVIEALILDGGED